MKWWTRLKRFCFRWWSIGDISDDPLLKDAYAWTVPKEVAEQDIPSALEYAKEKYLEASSTFDKLDDKAEKLFIFAATLLAAVGAAMGALLTAKPDIVAHSLWILLAIIPLVAAAVSTITIRNASEKGVPMRTPKFIQHGKVVLVESYHIAFVRTRIVNEWKAHRLNIAAGLVILSLVLLWVILAVAACVVHFQSP